MLYNTYVGEHLWESLNLHLEGPALSFWGERHLPKAPTLDFFDRPDDPEDPNTPTSTGDSDDTGSSTPSNGSDDSSA